jgi:signal transduction histidine kinase
MSAPALLSIRRLLYLTAAWLALAAPGVEASCLPLPSAKFAALDRKADRDPEAAAHEALVRIEALGQHPDALTAAQLYAVVSVARYHQSRVAATREAAAKAEALLDTLPPSPDADRVRVRVRVNVADTSEYAEAFDEAVRSMNGLVANTKVDTLEHSCALSIRGQAQSELGNLALAATDAFEAYRIAEAGHWPDAKVTAAYVLATIYRRSSLLHEAERMIDEVVAFAEADQRTPMLSTASYVRGQVLADMHRYDEARSAFELSRSSALRIGDQFGAVIVGVPLCLALINEGDLATAERICNHGDPEFQMAGAGEFLSLLVSYRARIDLARNRPAAAIAKLDSVLAPSGAGRLLRVRAQALRDRAAAYQSLGRYREAYRDLRNSIDVGSKADIEQQALTVAVLSATAASEKLVASNRVLQERNELQQEELAHRKVTQQLWFVIAIAAVLVSILFGYLLAVTRRHEREVARQDVIRRTMSSNAPDAMMLLNMDRTVGFSNRGLLGTGPAPAPGTPLGETVPATALGPIDEAIDRLIESHTPVSFPVSVQDARGAISHFELRAAPVLTSGTLIGITLRASDVTEFRRLESEVIDVATRERQRLSSDLHEGLGQELTGISLLLASLSTAIERRSDDIENLVSEIRDVVSRCIDMTRELARGLSPVQIERGSLGNALNRLATDASRRLRLNITSDSTPVDIIVSDVASDHLYRIAYEALTNAARHSGCKHVSIELWIDDGTLNLSVSDDGAGMPSPDADGSGLGVDMMRYRARLLGGSLELGPGPDGGVQVLVSVPVGAVAPDSAATGDQDDDAREDHAR